MDPRLRGGDTEDRSLRLGPRLRPAALFGGLGRGAGDLERQFVVLPMDAHLAALDQLSEQQFLAQRLLDLLLDPAAHRVRAVRARSVMRGAGKRVASRFRFRVYAI